MEEENIRTHSTFPDLCLRDSNDNCCQSWSLGNYIAFLSNKANCSQIDEEDVHVFTHLLKNCSVYYHNYMLKYNCDPENGKSFRCENVPYECAKLNAVYDILHFVTDVESFHSKSYSNKDPVLQMVVSYLPIVGSPSIVELYRHVENWAETLEKVKIIGADFGIKYTLFNENLMADTKWLIIAGCVIFTIIWIYTASLFISIMTFLMMFWSLQVAYFIYMMIFEITFFPYMNLVTIIIVIAIGADDVFLYTKVWQAAKSEPNNGSLEKIISDTLRHATMSMFVTSFTTAAALFTNAVSSITAIKCFSIYAGTTVLCNFILVVTWLPASIVIYEKWCNCEMWYSPEFLTEKNLSYYLCKIPHSAYQHVTECSKAVFDRFLPCVVIKLRFLWILLYGSLGIGGIIVIFYYPKLKLPSSEKFQVFSSDHLFEQYDFVLNNYFWFEREHKKHMALLPLSIVWGVLPVDNGNTLDPTDTGHLQFDFSFNPTTSNAQKWILKFCKDIRAADFYQEYPGFQLTNCFFDSFQELMSRRCHDFMANKDLHPCCNATSENPISSATLMICLDDYMRDLAVTPRVRMNHYSPGPRFDYAGRISAFVIQFLSNSSFSFSYHKMNQFYSKVNQWMNKELKTAPPELKSGFFISELSFFDLQNSLLEETPMALGVSLIVVAIVTFLTTLNFVISFLAILSIGFVMFTTIGAIVLLGWDLNILESVIITVAIGMSVDYTLHYAVSYRLSPDLDRETRVRTSTSRLGSVIFMAGATTFLAGLVMMPSTVLVYQKFGIFLMLIISISWAYSTLFFQSLLCVCGPKGGCTQFHWPTCDCCTSDHGDRRDKTVYSTSESTVSTSSSFHHTGSSSEGRCDLDPPSELFENQNPTSRTCKQSRSHSHTYKFRRRSEDPESPEIPVRRSSRVRFSFGSVGKSVSAYEGEEDSSFPPHCRSRAESEVFIEEEVT